MTATRRHDMIEQLLGVLLEKIPLQLPKETQDSLLEEASGSWVIPYPINSERFMWTRASLHWMWQQETNSCCLNFLAQEGRFEWGTIEAFQWTLETSHNGGTSFVDSSFSDIPLSEFRRFELTTSDSVVHPSNTPVRSFWKMASLKILCVEWQVVTLMGTLNSRQLDPRAMFSCGKIILNGAFPSSSQDHIHLAHVVSWLDSCKTPQLQWRSPLADRMTKFESLADLFRFAYALLEDQENPLVNAIATTNAAKSQSHRGMDIRKSIGDSLAITGGLVATGASFVSPIGAAVSVAAIGVKDGVTMAAQKGKETRNDDNYKFGDVTRGIVSSLQDRKARRSQQKSDDNDDDEGNNNRNNTCLSEDSSQPSYIAANKARYVGVVGSSVGAVAGLALAGPIGLIAGSFLVGNATQAAMRQKEETHQQVEIDVERPPSASGQLYSHSNDSEILRQLERDTNHHKDNIKKPWKFGDNIRNAVQRGKEATGRDATSEYHFGDFSRGLFSDRK